ncbi:MAG: 3-hydroxyacyl-CoA dehydrogenase NAD-binding domain-containing protein [Burkholderiaceae bacterium]
MTRPVLDVIGKSHLELGRGADQPFGSWRLRREADKVAWALLDCPGADTNTITRQVLVDLSALLDAVRPTGPSALVLRSAKQGGFAAGADIQQFATMSNPAEAQTQLREAHDVLDALEAFPCPTIAVVHGYALGAGFEIALACDYRIAIEGSHFAFPEVRLGLHPGLGGTFRLTERIEPVKAMAMMLTGKPAYADKAESLGIVDIVTRERHVEAALRDLAGRGKPDHGARLRDKVWDLAPTRHVAARRMRARTAAKAPSEHYPAPHALIDLWEAHGGDRDAMRRAEIESFTRLLATDTAKNLIRVFFLRQRLSKRAQGDATKRHVHVVGAGTMGAEIAGWCAIKGHLVTLSDISLAAIGKAMRSTAKLASTSHLGSLECRDALDRLIPDPHGHGAKAADLIIEAAPEKLDVKREILRSLALRMRADAIIATNTSSLSLESLRDAVPEPARFAGLHFFNPVSKLELVEVISHDASSVQTMRALEHFLGSIDRLPVTVQSAPGFLVNRILTPYLLEAIMMCAEGNDPERMDSAAEAFGMPMGPLELADRIGLDICVHVADSLRGALEKPLPDTPAWLLERVARGDLGRKTGRGFYQWEDDRPRKDTVPTEDSQSVQDRLILPMLDAAVACLHRGVVNDAQSLDAAMIFATGFAPFRGGPIHYARALGAEVVVARLRALAQKHGPRFEPDEGWHAFR